MDAVQPLAHLARAAALFCAKAGLCGLRDQEVVSVGGEGLADGKTSNNQHPTTNIQVAETETASIRCWRSDVGCWMFCHAGILASAPIRPRPRRVQHGAGRSV